MIFCLKKKQNSKICCTIDDVFNTSQVLLCTVHVMRAWRRSITKQLGITTEERELLLKYLCRMMYADTEHKANEWKQKIQSLDCYARQETSYPNEWTVKKYIDSQYFGTHNEKSWLLCHRTQYHNQMDTTNGAESWNK